MMNYKVRKINKAISGQLTVPASKSIANRLLIIQTLSGKSFKIDNLSTSDDTKVLFKALTSNEHLVDIGHAGTAMRFACAYFSNSKTVKRLTGSERMKNRPIGSLVDALKSLGADIEYTEREGYPPLLINGKPLKGGNVSIDSSVSSQFISALLMIAPTFKEGLDLRLDNDVISSSYIQMTIDIMKYMGVEVVSEENRLKVAPQKYIGKDIFVEGDWSGVSYWYQMAAFAENPEIFIKTLQKESFQGDAAVAEVFKPFGIQTDFFPDGIRITKKAIKPDFFQFDFVENPDLVQTLAVTCVMLDIPFKFEGTQTLRIKETDRIAALQNELAKFGASLKYADNGILIWDGKKNKVESKSFTIPTYHDHRMALAFAPIALLGYDMIIEEPNVVNKSYPEFWNDLKLFGFDISEHREPES